MRKTIKFYLSPDYFLQLENMKLEPQVIVKKFITVNKFLDFVHTARHATGICYG